MTGPSAIEQRLAELASALGGTENFLVNAVPGEVWLPAAPSRAAEMREAESAVSQDDLGWSGTFMILMAMLDHMKTLGVLLRPGNYAILGAPVITRSCLEAAARLRWVAEPGAEAAEALRRVHILRCAGLKYQVEMYEAFDAPTDAVEQRRARYRGAVDLAQQHGATTTTAPGHTRLVRELFDDPTARTMGAGVYNLLSGIAHASPPSLMEFFRSADPPARLDGLDPTGTFVQPAVRLDQLELHVQLAAYGVCRALDALLPFAGWPDDLWPNWRRHFLETAFRGVDPPDA